LASVLAGKKPGDKITLKVWRNGEGKDFSITLAELSE